MVNELSVYCPRHEQGCAHICQRQYIESHLKYHCQYTMAPCKLDECKELLLKKDLGTHVKTCRYRIVECNMCKKKMCSYELEVCGFTYMGVIYVMTKHIFLLLLGPL